MEKSKITFIDNFISAEDAAYLIESANSNTKQSVNSFNEGAIDFTHDNLAFNILKKYSILAKNQHIRLNNITQDLYIFRAFGFKWNDGWSQDLHIDAYGPGKSLELSTVVYLNDDYDGGEIIFPKQNIIYKPKKYSAVFFPAKGEEYLHGVTQIKNSSRYSLLFLFTYDYNDANKLFM